MTKQHRPITPPPELVRKWEDDILNERENVDLVLDCAWKDGFRAGADQELKASCDAIYEHEGQPLSGGTAEWLRTARRPKPPSQAEQAIAELDEAVMRGDCITTTDAMPSLRAALERLKELEQVDE